MSKTLAITALVAFLAASPEALAQKPESVTGHFVSAPRKFPNFDGVIEITVNAVRLSNGGIAGKLVAVEKTIVGGKVIHADEYRGEVDEMIIDGKRAYVRSANRYFLLEDGGEGVQAAPDGYLRLTFVGGTPPLALIRTLLDRVFPFNNYVAKHGNLQVRE